jgi:SAM-dependent methyltransferase
MSTVEPRWGASANAEVIEAWDGPLFERFVQFREVFASGLGAHGEAALGLYPPQPGQHVLDVGCGWGDTALRIAELVGPSGSVVGVDAAPRFIELARAEAAEAGRDNVSYAVADVQTTTFEHRFDMAFSRMGTMFFTNPVPAMRNVREALAPGGRVVMVVWRTREDNEWVYRGQEIVEAIVQKPEEYDEPTCGPGPFSMANASTTSDILKHAGFTDITLHRVDLPLFMGRTVEEAIEVVMALGPAGEIIRLQGDRIDHLRGHIREKLLEGYEAYRTADGVLAPSSTWVVTALNPTAR